MKKEILSLMLIAGWAQIINASRPQIALANITIKNAGNKPITVETHNGLKTINAGSVEAIRVQRGQAYEITAHEKNKKMQEIGRKSAKFTPGDYIVNMEPNPQGDDTNVVNIIITKKKIVEESKKPRRTLETWYE